MSHNFEDALQKELDKLPFEPHADDGMFNDGQISGFEAGARWALDWLSEPEKKSSLKLPTND